MVKCSLSYGLWPLLLVSCLGVFAYGFSVGQPILYFNLAYFALAFALFFLERLMPFEKIWQEDDKQTFANLAHTVTSKGAVQGLILFGGIIGITTWIAPIHEQGHGIWPRDWPMAVQIIMGLVVAEFGLYWAHRIAHEWPPLWRFHAIHHSVTRLWFINTGRFHFVDSVFSIALAIAILVILGAPLEVVTWLSAVTAYIGLLTHCNVDMKFGWLSLIFNTPGLHRWHHSRDLTEGNKNYGENLMIWDHVFGTWINPNRRPPADIGIPEAMPASFWQQILWPFRKQS